MRGAKINDYWRKTYTREYNYAFESINLNGNLGIDGISFNKGIFALCGLNGAGKSTIINSLKDVLGINLDRGGKIKVNNSKIDAKFLSKDGPVVAVNSEGMRIKDTQREKVKLYYIDHQQVLNSMKFLSQKNIGEFLEQQEKYPFTNEDIEMISYIVGKDYTSCMCSESTQSSEMDAEEEDLVVAYFDVIEQGIQYDSLRMGLGEYVLFYFYWVLKRMADNSILLIEEPETFLSIFSQERFADYLAKQASERGITIVVATHSPYIIKRIPKRNIAVISRLGNKVSIVNGEEDSDVLRTLGMEVKIKGSIYVEDEMAKKFLLKVMRDAELFAINEYSIEVAGSESNITKIVMFPKSDTFYYDIIGIYDGDMREKITDKQKKELVCKYCFLPGDLPIEQEFKALATKKLQQLEKLFGKKQGALIKILSSIGGLNYHDWFRKLAKELCVSEDRCLDVLYDVWYNEGENAGKVNSFIEELKKIL